MVAISLSHGAAWKKILTRQFELLVLATHLIALAGNGLAQEKPTEPNQNVAKAPDGNEWKSLFNGRDLKDWDVTKFGGEGDVFVEDGQLILDFGASLTGVTYKKPTAKIDYEVQLEARRVDGNDFFCAFTFPVKESFCSLIVGGWGGGIVGLSSLDDFDASENATTSYQEFKKGQWYAIKLRVRPDRIQTWIDKKQVIDEEIRGRKISIRNEVDLSRPFGFATWETRGALRKIQIRSLKPSATKK